MVEYYNPNPTCKFFKSGKPKNWYINDSEVRAIAKALNLSWEEAYDILSKTGRQLYNVPMSNQVIADILSKNNFKFITYGKPKHGENRLTVEKFAKENNKGTYVLNLASYFVTIVDGVIYDVNDKCCNSSVYSYWVYNK